MLDITVTWTHPRLILPSRTNYSLTISRVISLGTCRPPNSELGECIKLTKIDEIFLVLSCTQNMAMLTITRQDMRYIRFTSKETTTIYLLLFFLIQLKSSDTAQNSSRCLVVIPVIFRASAFKMMMMMTLNVWCCNCLLSRHNFD